MATKFADVYNRFLGQITDDLYVELTPEDTLKDLQGILLDSLPEFEFCKKNLMKYTLEIQTIPSDEATEEDFVLGIVWEDVGEEDKKQYVYVDKSYFDADLTAEEILIISKIMLNNWLQRQITSIENIRMKYSGSDFKMTSQANHLAKLVTLQDKVKQQVHHFQRLYGRRRLSDDTGLYESNWDVFKKTNYWYDD